MILPLYLKGVFNTLATGTYLVKHAPPSSIIEGRVVANPDPTTFYIQASIQPLSPQDLMRLPEGERTIDSITIWTMTPLQLPDAPAGTEGDTVYYGNHTYQVSRAFQWAESGGYGVYVAQKDGQ